MTGDKIDKLIEMVSKQSELLPDKHASDATELKKEWFNYVLISLEKTNSAIDKLEDHRLTAAKDLLQGLMKTKEDLRLEITGLRSAYDVSLDKLEKRIEKSLDILSKKVDSISIPAVKQELKLEINKLKTEILLIINSNKESLMKDDLNPLKRNVTTLMVKVGFIGVIGGILGSGLIMAAVAIFKHWMGGV